MGPKKKKKKKKKSTVGELVINFGSTKQPAAAEDGE